MIKLSGCLSIRTINGRNGAFNVGRLATDIGEFTVKDALIEEYEEGRYDGDFGISRIYPAHYLTGGRMVIELRATLASISLSDIDHRAPSPAMPADEADPIDETPTALAPAEPVPPPSEPEAPPAGPGEASDATDDGGEDTAALFATLWPLGTEVKLDPTVDRVRFRRQRDWLKENGFAFRPVGQVWYRV